MGIAGIPAMTPCYCDKREYFLKGESSSPASKMLTKGSYLALLI